VSRQRCQPGLHREGPVLEEHCRAPKGARRHRHEGNRRLRQLKSPPVRREGRPTCDSAVISPNSVVNSQQDRALSPPIHQFGLLRWRHRWSFKPHATPTRFDLSTRSHSASRPRATRRLLGIDCTIATLGTLCLVPSTLDLVLAVGLWRHRVLLRAIHCSHGDLQACGEQPPREKRSCWHLPTLWIKPRVRRREIRRQPTPAQRRWRSLP